MKGQSPFKKNKLNKSKLKEPYDTLFIDTNCFRFIKPQIWFVKSKISFQQRCRIVKLMICSQIHLKLSVQTLFLAIDIFDKCLIEGLQVENLSWENIATVTLFIASIQSETQLIYNIDQFINISQITLKQAEIQLLQVKIIEICHLLFKKPSSYKFLKDIVFQANQSRQTQKKTANLAFYILQLSIFYEPCFKCDSMLIGYSSFYLARKLCKEQQSWPKQLSKFSGYQEKDLIKCAKDLQVSLCKSQFNEHSSPVSKKFATKEYDEVGCLLFEDF